MQGKGKKKYTRESTMKTKCTMLMMKNTYWNGMTNEEQDQQLAQVCGGQQDKSEVHSANSYPNSLT